jgi:UDP-N-acetyl-alpha-D-quinovosamine dehydrogenase
MIRVVVTGASGFVGRFARRALEARGANVVAAGRATLGGGGATDARASLGPGTSLEQMLAVLEGASSVVHLAAAVHDVRGRTSPAEYLRVNRDYPLRLAEAAASAGVARFVFASTIKVNGESTRGREAFRESSEVAPQGPYAVSKWQAEEGLRRLSAACRIQTRIVRPPLVYGAGVRANFLRLMQWVKRGVPLPFAAFDNARSLIYVENLADVLARLAMGEGEAVPSRTYLVSDGEDVSTSELVRRIAVALRVAPRLFHVPEYVFRHTLVALNKRDMAERLVGSLRVDSGRAQRELGWFPPFSFDQGLSRTAAWFLGQP